jgi:exosortase family protein XrtM
MNLRAFTRNYRREIRFFLLFLLFFLAGQGVHYATQSWTAPFLVNVLNAGAGSKIINGVTPGEETRVEGNTIVSGSFRLNIAQGCEGIEGFLLIGAAILAFYMSIRLKLLGLLWGFLVIYFANLLRIVLLYYVLKYRPSLFDFMHIFVGQTFIIVVGILFFVFWVGRSAPVGGKNG